MTDVAILGASGYTALELIKLLLRHPSARITALTTRQEGNPRVAEFHPSLSGRIDLPCEMLTAAQLAERAECVFSALPHTASMAVVPELLQKGCRVVDLSADYRLSNAETYEAWYGVAHTDAGNLAQAVYGLAELNAQAIADARLVAGPGCYPTTAILALAPLLAASQIELNGIVVDAKSGVSGAGRSPKLTTHFPECNESVSAYNVGRHRHTPEIDQELTKVAGQDVQVVFTPHLIPMDRGILATTYAQPARSVGEAELQDSMQAFYADKPFVRVVSHLPATKDSVGTNYCDVAVRLVRGRVIVLSCLDNLVKGAAGAAVQSFNLMCGFPETAGLI
jgi:N-acetyl-gamma-glutamyl-phosphate reductase